MALLACAWLVSGCGPSESPAFQAYKSFVNASTRGDCTTLYALAEGDAIAYVDNLCKPRSMTLMGQTVNLGSVAGIVAGIRPSSTPYNNPMSLERTIESETRSADRSTVDLVVVEKSFQRNGSVREPTWLLRHTVTAKLKNGVWKLTRFNEEVLHKYEAGEVDRETAGKQKRK
jgi:hypothetical protein